MIQFQPLSEEAFEAYVAQAAEEYAAEHVRGGRWTAEEAPEAARAEYARLLPQGTATPDHYLRHAVDAHSGETVGLIWYWHEQARQRIFIYDITIEEGYRRRGYARRALERLEVEARALGAREIALHVFGHNTAARTLYETMGFEETNVIMRKELGGGD